MADRKKTQQQEEQTEQPAQQPLFFEDIVAQAGEQQEEEEELERETFAMALRHACGAEWLSLAERLETEPEQTIDAINWWIHLSARGNPPRPLLGEGCFAIEEELLACQLDDPLLVFENTMALIRLYEEAGNYPEALRGFYELKEMTDQHGDEPYFQICLQEMEAFCWNHQYNNEGIEVCEALAMYHCERYEKEYGFALMQKAMYLGRRDGFMGGLEEFRRLEAEMPEHDWVFLNLARYFSDYDHKAEAVEQYRLLIGQRDEINEEVLSCAFTEAHALLKELGRAEEAEAIADLARDLLGEEKYNSED
jgi:tetratricopeptide (TPR) repeat protein